MRRAQEVAVRPGRQKSRSVSLPAPIGGLNGRDALSNMAATDAIVLENFFPDATFVRRRKGNSTFATFTGDCQTAVDYAGLTSTKLFVCVKNGSDFRIIEATAGGAISTAVVGGSGPAIQALTSTIFDSVNIGTTGGQFLLMCNGTNPMLEYDGTTWSAGAITGVTGGTSAIKTMALFQNRLFMLAKDTFDVWYLAVGTKAGAATRLNMGSLFELGGSLSALVTLSLDSASQTADHIGFVSTQGEIVVYKGDVADAASWTRVAVVRLGRPIMYGQRTWAKIGGEAVITTVDGVMPLSQSIVKNTRDTSISLSDKIRGTYDFAINTYGTAYNTIGFAVIFHPFGRKLLFNVYAGVTSYPREQPAYQLVMNTETKAWCKFTNWNAICWLVTGDLLYYGMDGKLVQADTGNRDQEEATVNDRFIVAYAKQAFNYFGSRGTIKHFKALRFNEMMFPGYLTDIYQGINVDFQDFVPTDFLNQSTLSSGGVDYDTIISEWIGTTGAGYCAAPYLALLPANNGLTFAWASTDIIFETGGVL